MNELHNEEDEGGDKIIFEPFIGTCFLLKKKIALFSIMLSEKSFLLKGEVCAQETRTSEIWFFIDTEKDDQDQNLWIHQKYKQRSSLITVGKMFTLKLNWKGYLTFFSK